jgi:hypothetical protein
MAWLRQLRITLLGELRDGQWGMTIALLQLLILSLGFLQDGDDRIGVIFGIENNIARDLVFAVNSLGRRTLILYQNDVGIGVVS